jgi:hypothetical protein
MDPLLEQYELLMNHPEVVSVLENYKRFDEVYQKFLKPYHEYLKKCKKEYKILTDRNTTT